MNPYQEQLDFYKAHIQEQAPDKYAGWGIYGIYINNKLVYVGKSTDLLTRIANHCLLIEGLGKPNQVNSNKYRVLRQARDQGHKVRFELLEYTEEDEDKLGFAESAWINLYMPKLNTQIPKPEDWRHWTINKQAGKITLEQILGGTKYDF